MKKILIENIEFENLRIDKFLKFSFSSLNQSFIEKNLRKGNIKVNNIKVESKYKLQKRDEIIIYNYNLENYSHQPKVANLSVIPSKYNKLFKNSIIYENNDFLILDKWNGIATQGGSKINISIDHIIKNISKNYNLVHRLDRETSGLLIIAKNLQSTKYFGKLFKEHLIQKFYVSICNGHPKNNESRINLKIPDQKIINKVSESVTRYKVYQINDKLSSIIFSPETGKTHQIRIVAKHLGCPIIGDNKYNSNNKYNFEKLKLNAYILKFMFKNHDYEFSSKLPNHFINFFEKNNLDNIKIKRVKQLFKIF